ncbi:transcription antitermination factor NusB [Legionella fairfieldensis]|uniref:transcription antitermination factor NusB n=1 Tax=Legionella fairfieldensis TaxID=45064 RepID=UPI00048C12C1|nr:transcription antitermination factor NusB [Legionella fairfieldensis]
MEKQSIKGKRRARKLALQALYQWLMSGHELYEVEAQFRVANNMDKVDTEYFCRLLHGVPGHIKNLEENLIPFLDRPIQSLNPVELTVLRLSAFELFHCAEIPYRVILDEAISLTKAFGSQDGYRYVNGVLNNLAQKVRAVEISHSNE